MVKHQETHPGLDEPGCDMCRYSTVAIAPSATPTRKGGARAAEVNATERRWAKDHAAYRRLVKDGLQPDMLDGAAKFEQQANHAIEIERGTLGVTNSQVAQAAEATAEMRELNA